jgi:hypothetical protein
MAGNCTHSHANIHVHTGRITDADIHAYTNFFTHLDDSTYNLRDAHWTGAGW